MHVSHLSKSESLMTETTGIKNKKKHNNVLLYDDTGILDQEIKRDLEALGFAIAGIAKNGEEALEISQQHHPDIFIMDLHNKRKIEHILPAIESGVKKQKTKSPNLLLDTSHPSLQQSLWAHSFFLNGIVENSLPLLQSSIETIHSLIDSEHIPQIEAGALRRVHHHLETLTELINRASLTTDWIGSSFSWIKVSELVKEAAESSANTLTDHQAIEISMHENVPNILGDQELLKHALTEILDNALRYSSHTTNPVTFSVEPIKTTVRNGKSSSKKHMVCFRVIDSGPGISKEELPRLLAPFHSTEENRIGLGLSIALGVVHHHGGWMEFYSANNGGADIRILLPCCI